MNNKELRLDLAETIERHTGANAADAYDASVAICEKYALTVDHLPPHVRRAR